jgi:hypothetical protein
MDPGEPDLLGGDDVGKQLQSGLDGRGLIQGCKDFLISPG